MNRDIILANPYINGGMKKLKSENNTTVVNLETGDTVREIKEHTGYVG